jgi:2,3-bisphosphoglycerate-independent phosphoglycerate mutase
MPVFFGSQSYHLYLEFYTYSFISQYKTFKNFAIIPLPMNGKEKQIALIILDGWGYREDPTHNAVAAAKTPNFNKLWKEYPHTLLEASGLAVGLPEGQMGNSEIGHTTIGAGKIIDTDLVRIAKAIKNDEFKTNKAFNHLFEHVKQNGSTLHVKGLIGLGGVHAHSDHLFAFLKTAKEAGVTKIAIHAFTDGRDTAPQSAHEYLLALEAVLAELGVGFIATASGRFYAMDRDNNWDRLKRVEDALFERKGKEIRGKNPSEVVKELYKEGILDEHMEPIVFLDDSGHDYRIKENDGVFFFNFRADRARMLSKKIAEKMSSHNICFVTLTEYEKSLGALVAFPQSTIETTLAAEIAYAGMTQAHIAETEKFPHATYFLNGGRETPHEGEVHIMLDSRKDVPTHDLAPKMRAEGIADKTIEAIKKGTNFIFINFANPDMVGHTANVPAIIEALEEVDTQLGRVMKALEECGGVAFITADHGNAEVNIDPTTGERHTSHTINPVPAIFTEKDSILRDGGTLADITPTILMHLGIPQPPSMKGKNLLQ